MGAGLGEVSLFLVFVIEILLRGREVRCGLFNFGFLDDFAVCGRTFSKSIRSKQKSVGLSFILGRILGGNGELGLERIANSLDVRAGTMLGYFWWQLTADFKSSDFPGQDPS